MAEILIHESRKSKLKWKDIPKFKDSYRWPVVQIQEHEGSLYFKFSGGSKYSPNTYFTIEDYRKYTALEIFNILVNIGFYTRHSHDAVLKFYHDRGLDLGFTRNFLKPLKAYTMSTEQNMINEDFVTFEVAKLLQDKGYREDCHASYITDETGRSELTVVFGRRKFRHLSIYTRFQYEYLAPTLYAAQKWVRKKRKIHIVVELNKHGWYYRLYDMEDLSLISQMDGYTDTFEKALNDGIKESLTYL